jgi:hypothetical protein
MLRLFLVGLEDFQDKRHRESMLSVWQEGGGSRDGYRAGQTEAMEMRGKLVQKEALERSGQQ